MRAKCFEGSNLMTLQHGTVQLVISSKFVSGLSGCSVQHDTQMKARREIPINPWFHRVREMLREEIRELEESGV